MPIKIVLVGIRRLSRHGLRAILESSFDFIVVGEVGAEVNLPVVMRETRPDVIIIDDTILGSQVVMSVSLLQSRYANCPIIVLTAQGTIEAAEVAFKSGATAYISTNASAASLFQSVRSAALGRLYLSPEIMVDDGDRSVEKQAPAAMRHAPQITPRESEVIQLAAEGLSNIAIGHRLAISSRTVEIHRSRAMRKLGLRNNTELVRYALRVGVIDLA